MNTQRVWQREPLDVDQVQPLAEALDVDPLIATLLLHRGHTDPTDAHTFMAARLADMPDPGLMADIQRAADRLVTAALQGENIVVYGDYDVDGITSSAVLRLFFKDLFGQNLSVYIPHRLKEGYGLNVAAIDAIADQGASVMVTVDNGSSAYEEIVHAQSRGVDTIIVDHHQVSDPEPPAFAHLNPHRQSCDYPYKGLAAVGVVFLLLVEIRRSLRTRSPAIAAKARPDRYLDLVALGTVADVAPLTGLNRAIVRYGINSMRRWTRPGVMALMETSGCDAGYVTARDFGYKLGPRLNAAGRMDDAAQGLHLLCGTDPLENRQLARAVEEQNTERKALQKVMVDEAMEQASSTENTDASVLVLAGENWHPGVVGIVASRIVEAFHRPAVLLALDAGLLKGSARSTPDVNIKAALDRCAPHLMRYGGHVMAAGMTLRPDELTSFRSALIDAVDSVRTPLSGPPPLMFDAEVDAHRFDNALLDSILELGPFGHANPAPRLVSRSVHARGKVLRGGHLKLFIESSGGIVEGLAWNRGDDLPLTEGPVDILYSPDREVWRGRSKTVFRIHDLRRSS